MRKYLAPIVAAVVTALTIATLAIAQPGVGFSRSADFSGTGSSGSAFELSTNVTMPGKVAIAGNTSDYSLTVMGSSNTFGNNIALKPPPGDTDEGSNIRWQTNGGTSRWSMGNNSTNGVVTHDFWIYDNTNNAYGLYLKPSGTSELNFGTTVGGLTYDNTTHTLIGRTNGLTRFTQTDTRLTLAGLLTVNDDATFEGGTCVINNAGITCGGTLLSGTISGVTAGTGLTGGGTSGAVTLDVGCGTGILCAANDVTLNMTAQSCSAGQHLSAATATGVFTCTADAGGITNSASANFYAKSNGTNLVNGNTKDDGTNWTINTAAGGSTARVTIVEASGNATFAGTMDVTGNFNVNTNKFSVVASSGNTTVAGNMGVNGLTPSPSMGIQVQEAPTGYTFASYGLKSDNNATMDTTAGGLIAYGVYGVSVATRSAGANNLTNYGIYGNAAGGQVNYSGFFNNGQFHVGGAADFGSTMAITGNVDVNTNKFNITASSGNTLIAGTLGVTGLLTATAGGTTSANWTTTGTGDLVSGDDLTVADDATISDTLSCTGDFKVNTTAFIVTASTGNTSVGGTLDVASTFTTGNSQLADIKGFLRAKFLNGDTSTPTLASCASGNINSNSNNLVGQFGTSGSTSCTITWSGTWPTAPWCHVEQYISGATVPQSSMTMTTTTMAITGLLDGYQYVYWCTGGN